MEILECSDSKDKFLGKKEDRFSGWYHENLDKAPGWIPRYQLANKAFFLRRKDQCLSIKDRRCEKNSGAIWLNKIHQRKDQLGIGFIGDPRFI